MTKKPTTKITDVLRSLPKDKLIEAINGLSASQAEELLYDWSLWGRDKQFAPEGDWNTWFINAGRGFGKTRAGVEWVRSLVKSGHKRIAAIAATNSDIERVMVKGESGFLSCCWKGDKTNRGAKLGYPEWSPTKRTLTWENGAQVQFFSAEEPERLRGPQFEAAWCFTEGHKIETKFGKLSIERVKVGTKVYTSNGLEEVTHTSIRNMPVGKVVFSDGTTLEGTYDHPIFTQRGWVPLGDLTKDDVCVKLNTMDTFGVSTRKDTTIQQVKELFTDTLLKSTMGKSPDLMSTTLMETNSTTTPAIFNYSQERITSNCTTQKEVSQDINQKVSVISLVMVAERLLSASKSLVKGFIAKVANAVGLKKRERSLQFVTTAGKLSTPEWEISALSVVSTWQPTGDKLVYNLRVENTHEYFCNGILTHNCDELAAWNRDRDTWDMLQFCLRLGKKPRVCVTTTPKPTKLVREIIRNTTTIITSGSTFDNSANLAAPYLEAVKSQYEGTRLGRQELYAEILDEASGALWNRATLEACSVIGVDDPVKFSKDLVRVVVSIDPAVTSNAESDMTGLVVAGIDLNGTSYILADHTNRYTPEQWASKAISLYNEYEADRIVAEKNQGGDMVKHTLRTVDETAPIKLVHASRGKYARAEPIASLYERGKVKHLKGLDQLEDQMVQWEPLGSIGSPDRLDAMVWAVTELALKGFSKPDLNLSYADAKSSAPSKIGF